MGNLAILSVLQIYLSGYVKAKMDDIRVYMQTNLLVRNEHPQIEITDCSTDVQQLYVYIIKKGEKLSGKQMIVWSEKISYEDMLVNRRLNGSRCYGESTTALLHGFSVHWIRK
ncbi:hypothetical protein WUBG_15691 [Wuchereria bancrofti]|uniref:Uncharacterized protein n=2 Tax=Wuchereria bancrofti TaxID=6293 RepID=J9EDB1_WUCBA|nr:hypothetical protein WUBG_15691 [Wuchereria bancrofti]